MTWFSQAGQDEFVHSIIGNSGFFCDVGAYDGIEHSNTLALEQFGWTGVCIEPNASACLRLCNNRTARVKWFAMSDHHGADPFDGTRLVPDQPGHDCVPVAPLHALLLNVAAPPVIDYLSIDTEGHDLTVLEGMKFDRWSVRLITVEHNEYLEGPARKIAIRDYLTERGFECVELDVVAPGYGVYESWYRNPALA